MAPTCRYVAVFGEKNPRHDTDLSSQANFKVIRSHQDMELNGQPDLLYALELLLRKESPDVMLFYHETLGD